MPRSDHLAPILRRWYVVILGLLITAGVLAAAAGSTQATYRAEATSVLLPGDTTIPEGGNRFLYLGNLLQARDVVLTALNSDAVRQQVLGDRTDWDYIAVSDTVANGPMIVISASASEALDAMTLRQTVQVALRKQLDSLQDAAKTPEDAKFTSLTLDKDAEATSEGSGLLRGLLVLGLLGVGLSLVAAGAIDALIRSREAARSRRREKLPPGNSALADEPEAAEPTEPDPWAASDSANFVAATQAGVGQRGSG